MKSLSFLILILFITKSSNCDAALDKNLPEKALNEIISEGAFNGGQAGEGFSLLDLKRVVSLNKKAERMIFEIGTVKGEKYNGQPGYFHVQLSKHPPELVIDFAQTTLANFDSHKLVAMFKKSKLVRRTRMTTDNDDNSTNITMIFKRPIKARVYTLAPKENSPKVVIDIMSM